MRKLLLFILIFCFTGCSANRPMPDNLEERIWTWVDEKSISYDNYFSSPRNLGREALNSIHFINNASGGVKTDASGLYVYTFDSNGNPDKEQTVVKGNYLGYEEHSNCSDGYWFFFTKTIGKNVSFVRVNIFGTEETIFDYTDYDEVLEINIYDHCLCYVLAIKDEKIYIDRYYLADMTKDEFDLQLAADKKTWGSLLIQENTSEILFSHVNDSYYNCYLSIKNDFNDIAKDYDYEAIYEAIQKTNPNISCIDYCKMDTTCKEISIYASNN